MLQVTKLHNITDWGQREGSGRCLSTVTVVFITVGVQEPDVVLWEVVSVVMGGGLPCSAARGGSARVAAVTLKGTAAGGVHLLSPSAAGDGQMRSGPCRSPRRSVTTVELLKKKKKNIFNKKVENAPYTCALLQKLASDLHRQHFKPNQR